jgi:hypothetical protein
MNIIYVVAIEAHIKDFLLGLACKKMLCAL